MKKKIVAIVLAMVLLVSHQITNKPTTSKAQQDAASLAQNLTNKVKVMSILQVDGGENILGINSIIMLIVMSVSPTFRQDRKLNG